MSAVTASPLPPPIILMSTDQGTAINGSHAIETNNSVTSRHITFTDTVRSNLYALKREAIALFTFHPKEWAFAFRANSKYPLFTLGDIDGFVALFMNNLATLLAVILGLKLVFHDDIIYGKIVPGFDHHRHRTRQSAYHSFFSEWPYQCCGEISTTFTWPENWRTRRIAVTCARCRTVSTHQERVSEVHFCVVAIESLSVSCLHLQYHITYVLWLYQW